MIRERKIRSKKKNVPVRTVYVVRFNVGPDVKFFRSLCEWGNSYGLTKFISETPWPPLEYYEIVVPTRDLATEAMLRFSQ